MKNLRDLAKKSTTLSPVMDGKEKLVNRDIIAKYDGHITITRIDMITNPKKDSEYGIYNILEDETVFCNAGAVLTTMFKDLINGLGSIEQVNDELHNIGGLEVILHESRTLNGDTVMLVDVL